MRLTTVVLLVILNAVVMVSSFAIVDRLDDINYRLQSIIRVAMHSTRSN